MEDRNEGLLSAWLRLTSTVCNDRIVSGMPYNEALICNVLDNIGDHRLCATDLCRLTGMLKSQMNRTLNSMEEKGLISRERSVSDKRQVFVTLLDSELYRSTHEKTLAVVEKIVSKLGEVESDELIRLLNKVCDVAEEVFE